MKLYERVRKLSKLFDTQGKPIAESIDINNNTFRGYLKESRQHNLYPLLDLILINYPEISREWLYFGEGDMFHNTAPALSAHNGMGEKTGDLLNVVLGFAKIDDEDITATTSISKKRLEELRESRSLPTFSELEQLHLHFGINPAYFFTGNETTMYFPDDYLLRVIYALGKQGKAPTRQMWKISLMWKKTRLRRSLKNGKNTKKKAIALCFPHTGKTTYKRNTGSTLHGWKMAIHP